MRSCIPLINYFYITLFGFCRKTFFTLSFGVSVLLLALCARTLVCVSKCDVSQVNLITPDGRFGVSGDPAGDEFP